MGLASRGVGEYIIARLDPLAAMRQDLLLADEDVAEMSSATSVRATMGQKSHCPLTSACAHDHRTSVWASCDMPRLALASIRTDEGRGVAQCRMPPTRLLGFLGITMSHSSSDVSGGAVVVALIAVAIYLIWKAVTKAPPRTSGQAPGPAATSSIRPAQSAQDDVRPSPSHWVPPGELLLIHEFRITCGLLYVHDSASRPDERSYDPSLIEARLPVTRTLQTVDEAPSYWPSYSGLSPSQRARYLAWLSGGRTDPQIDQGYVFVFFYGVERRVLQELVRRNAWSEELDTILAELRRLLEIYPQFGSLQQYGGSLTQFLACFREVVSGTRLPLPSDIRRSIDLSPELKVGLGQIVHAQEPIPGDWALAWALADPRVLRRTPVTRCGKEFAQLFRLYYTWRFDHGMRVSPNKTLIRVEYRPASRAFSGNAQRLTTGLPDITVLKGPADILNGLVEECTNDLDEYSRALGRKTGKEMRDYLTAYLPSALLLSGTNERAARLLSHLKSAVDETGRMQCACGDLFTIWVTEPPGTPSRKQLELLAMVLEKLGYGIEPDVRLGARSYPSTARVVVFRLPAGADASVSGRYAQASSLLGLAALVGQSDGFTPEEVAAIMARFPDLSEQEVKRLDARVALIQEDAPTLQGMRTFISTLTDVQRASVGEALLLVAAADGRISTEEILALEKVYSAIGLGRDRLHSSLHALLAAPGQAIRDPETPVTVQNAARTSLSYAVPRPAGSPTDTTLVLDPEKIRRKRVESDAAFKILSQVFGTDVEESDTAEQVGDGGSGVLAALREPLASLARTLTMSETMSGAEWQRLCTENGVLAAGAIEEINAATLDAFGEALIFGADPLDIDPDVAGQLRREYVQPD